MNAIDLIFYFVLLVILSAIYDYYKKRRSNSLTSKIPGPRNYPLIGAPSALEGFYDIFYLLEKLRTNYGGIAKVWVFNKLTIVLTDPKYIQIVLNHPNCMEKDESYDLIKDVFSNSLLVSPVSTWKPHRKVVHPAFNGRNLNSFVGVFVKHSQMLVESLATELGTNKMFNIEKHVGPISFNILSETVFGIAEDKVDLTKKYCAAILRIYELGGQRLSNLWFLSDFIYKHSSDGREFSKLVKIWSTYVNNIVKQRHEEITNNVDFDDNTGRSFLEYIVRCGRRNMSLEDLGNELGFLTAAGGDTTTVVIGYVLVCLGMFKDVQEKAMEEIDSVFGNTDRPPTQEDLPKLTYLECVIKETMRVYPPVFQLPRRVTAEVDLGKYLTLICASNLFNVVYIGEYVLPAGSSAMVSIFATHRDPNLWPNPMKFDPDRFTPEEEAKRPPFSFLGFSGGPRDCLGRQYAMMNMKVMVTAILRSYKIDTTIKPKDTRLTTGVTTRMAGGFNISISKRI